MTNGPVQPINPGGPEGLPSGEAIPTSNPLSVEKLPIGAEEQGIVEEIQAGGNLADIAEESVVVPTDSSAQSNVEENKENASPPNVEDVKKLERILIEDASAEFKAVIGNVTRLNTGDIKLLDVVQPIAQSLRREDYNSREIDPRPVVQASEQAITALSSQMRKIREQSQQLGINSTQNETQMASLLNQVASTTDIAEKHDMYKKLLIFFKRQYQI